MAREGIDIIHSDGTTETWYATSVNAGTEVDPNPTMSGTETNLDGIGIDGTNYNITDVVANPTLAGTEASLTGLEVDGTKYAVGGSVGHKYMHYCSVPYGAWGINFVWINDNAEATAINPLIYIQTGNNNYFPVNGWYVYNGDMYEVYGLFFYNAKTYLRYKQPSGGTGDLEINPSYVTVYQEQKVVQIL